MATFVERKNRWYVVIEMSDSSTESMGFVILSLYSRRPKKVFKTAIKDRGKEYGCYTVLKKDANITFILQACILPGIIEAIKTSMDFFKSHQLNKVTDDELSRLLPFDQ